MPITTANGGFSAFKPAMGEWLLGTNADPGESKRITYEVMVPKDAPAGVYQIKGEVSTGTPSSEAAVTGSSEIEVTNTTLSHIWASASASNNGMIFTYELREAAEAVEIDIFDLSGRMVATVHGTTSVGQNEVLWDERNEEGEPLANGVYIYVVIVKGLDGTVIAGERKKLVVCR